MIWLIIYLIGVLVVLLMCGKSIITTPFKTWVPKLVAKMICFILLSWVFVTIFAIKMAWEN